MSKITCNLKTIAVREFCVNIFIVLILTIQWTIANPVGADWPAKRQKKTSCVSLAGPVQCILQGAHRTSFLSRQHGVMACFSFGVRSVQAEFFSDIVFTEYSVYCENFISLVIPKVF